MMHPITTHTIRSSEAAGLGSCTCCFGQKYIVQCKPKILNLPEICLCFSMMQYLAAENIQGVLEIRDVFHSSWVLGVSS